MNVNMIVTSWNQPFLFTINDMAEPTEDLPKLFRFVEARLPFWNSELHADYIKYLKECLERYVRKTANIGG